MMTIIHWPQYSSQFKSKQKGGNQLAYKNQERLESGQNFRIITHYRF